MQVGRSTGYTTELLSRTSFLCLTSCRNSTPLAYPRRSGLRPRPDSDRFNSRTRFTASEREGGIFIQPCPIFFIQWKSPGAISNATPIQGQYTQSLVSHPPISLRERPGFWICPCVLLVSRQLVRPTDQALL